MDETVTHLRKRAEAREWIRAWIREDAPVAVKMMMTPQLVEKLLDRLQF